MHCILLHQLNQACMHAARTPRTPNAWESKREVGDRATSLTNFTLSGGKASRSGRVGLLLRNLKFDSWTLSAGLHQSDP